MYIICREGGKNISIYIPKDKKITHTIKENGITYEIFINAKDETDKGWWDYIDEQYAVDNQGQLTKIG